VGELTYATSIHLEENISANEQCYQLRRYYE
jgi:hypothetical protein